MKTKTAATTTQQQQQQNVKIQPLWSTLIIQNTQPLALPSCCFAEEERNVGRIIAYLYRRFILTRKRNP